MRFKCALLVVLVTATTLVFPGLPALATSTVGPVVTPAQARAIVQAWQVTDNRANQTANSSLLTVIEAGIERTMDAADYRIAPLVGYDTIPSADLAALRVYVPRQVEYPASFLALVKLKFAGEAAPEHQWRAYLFQRDSHASRWKRTAAPLLDTPPSFDVGKDGYLPALVPSSLLLRPNALTASWQAAENAAGGGGTPRSPWAVNSFWRKYVDLSPGDAMTMRVQASSTHLPPVCFASHTGAVCFASSQLDVVDALSEFFIEHKSSIGIDTVRQQYVWGGIAQGHYSSLHAVADRQGVIVVPRKKPGAQLQLVGLRYGPLSGSGVLSPS